LHLVGILFPHINDDTRSKSHRILKRFLDDACAQAHNLVLALGRRISLLP